VSAGATRPALKCLSAFCSDCPSDALLPYGGAILSMPMRAFAAAAPDFGPRVPPGGREARGRPRLLRRARDIPPQGGAFRISRGRNARP
jgi:hypothetical protein